MTIVTANVLFGFDFTESIAEVNASRHADGEPPMTKEEIEDWVREDLVGYHFDQDPGALPLTIEVRESITMKNADRAARGAEALSFVDDGDDPTRVVDTLANIMHFCYQEGISMQDCVEAAQNHYAEEIIEEQDYE